VWHREALANQLEHGCETDSRLERGQLRRHTHGHTCRRENLIRLLDADDGCERLEQVFVVFKHLTIALKDDSRHMIAFLGVLIALNGHKLEARRTRLPRLLARPLLLRRQF
jgi:hypothetical protein